MHRQRYLKETGVTEDRLDVALAYYQAYPDEVDVKIRENARPLEHWRERYPALNILLIEHRPEAGAPKAP